MILGDPLNIAALVFDFDGTIADTERAHFEGIRHVLEGEGFPLSWETYHERYIGFDDRGAFLTHHADQGLALSEGDLHRLVEKKGRFFADYMEGQQVEPYPGVMELLQQAKSHHIPVALCTGALHADVEPLLKRFGIWDRFVARVTAEDTLRSKPDPAPYLRVVEELAKQCRGLRATDCLALEDTPSGIQSANAAGLRTIGVTHTHSPEQLADAWRIVPSLEGLRLFQ